MSMIHEITTGAPRNKQPQAQRPRRIQRPRQDLRPRQQGRQGPRRHLHQARPRRRPDADLPPLPQARLQQLRFRAPLLTSSISPISNVFDDGATVDAAALIEAGLVPDDEQPVKILGDGELDKKLTSWPAGSASRPTRKSPPRAALLRTSRAKPSNSPSPRRSSSRVSRSRRSRRRARRRSRRCRSEGRAETRRQSGSEG